MFIFRSNFRLHRWSLGRPDPWHHKLSGLWGRGWVGMTASPLSDYERQAVRSFLAGLPPERFHFERNNVHYVFGTYALVQNNVWFQNKTDADAYVGMLDSLPQRSDVTLVRPEAVAEIRRRLRGSRANWMLVEGHEAAVFTASADIPADLVIEAKMFWEPHDVSYKD